MPRLIIRPGALGDCILCLPALEHITTRDDEVWISSSSTALIDFAGNVRALGSTGIDLVGIDGVEPPRLLEERLKSFESIVTWYGARRLEFREALTGLNSKCTFLAALPPPDSNHHAVDFFARQVGAPPGLRPRVAVERVAQRNTIVFHPFSGSTRKNWPLAYYRELARTLDVPVEWTAGPEEELRDAVRFESAAELGKWMTGARLYVGNDSGVTHLAAAIGVPVIAIFVSTRPEIWAPRGECVEVLANPTVEDVQKAANRLLDSRSRAVSSERSACAPP